MYLKSSDSELELKKKNVLYKEKNVLNCQGVLLENKMYLH